MANELVRRRDLVMDRANRALDAAWPARVGDNYVREMLLAGKELETIAREMQANGYGRVEQSRTYRFLGSTYADLEPALGKEMLLKARQSYQVAETYLEGQGDELERAKLNFNYANTLRQIDPNDIAQLTKAKQQLLDSRGYFAGHEPQYLAQVDTALRSVENLLSLAPLANAAQRNMQDMNELEEQLDAGGNVGEIAEKMGEVMKRGGGAAGMVGSLQSVLAALPEEVKQDARFGDVQRQMQELSEKVVGGKGMSPEDEGIWTLLKDRLKDEAQKGNVSQEHAETLSGMMEEFGRIMSGDEKDVQALLAKLQKMKEFISGKFEMNHYLSHGIERPPAKTRAAELVELNWSLRRYLLEEMNRPEKGEAESKETLELSNRAARVDKRIYEACSDDLRALGVEKEEIRPLALAIRNFSARMNAMPARPIWRTAPVPVDTNAVFFSGAEAGKDFVIAVCSRTGLEVMPAPRGEGYSTSRWKQLQKAVTAIFDLRNVTGTEFAAVTYELGIALTIGKPIIVLVGEEHVIPFDVDMGPVVLTGGEKDHATLASAVDRSVVWTYPRPSGGTSVKTLEHILSLYQRPQQNVYLDQTLRILTDLRNEPDPLSLSRTLLKFYDYLDDGQTILINPRWPPVYPDGDKRRLFHVMPFRPTWADEVTEATREICNAEGITYVRGDEVDEPDVIRSIWQEIAGATHVLVDLTGYNANVALELGIAHTLGKDVLLVGQDDTVEKLFPSIEKLRFSPYKLQDLRQTLGGELRDFIAS